MIPLSVAFLRLDELSINPLQAIVNIKIANTRLLLLQFYDVGLFSLHELRWPFVTVVTFDRNDCSSTTAARAFFVSIPTLRLAWVRRLRGGRIYAMQLPYCEGVVRTGIQLQQSTKQ